MFTMDGEVHPFEKLPICRTLATGKESMGTVVVDDDKIFKRRKIEATKWGWSVESAGSGIRPFISWRHHPQLPLFFEF
jgi:hypothetical protein